MTDVLTRATEWTRSHKGKKLIRYTSVSVISTIVSNVTLLLLFGAFKVGTQVTDTLIANFVATFPSYYINRRWVWGKSGRSHIRKEVIPFWLMASLGIMVSYFGARLATRFTITHNLPHLEATIVVVAANILSFAVFWVLKLLLFNRIFHVKEIDEFDEHLSEEERTTSS